MLCQVYLLLLGLASVLSAPTADNVTDTDSVSVADAKKDDDSKYISKYVRADRNQDTDLKGHNIGDVYLNCQRKIITCRNMSRNASEASIGEKCLTKLPDTFTNCNKAAQGTYDCSGAMGSTLHEAEPTLIYANATIPVLEEIGFPPEPYDGSDEDMCRYLCQTMDKNDCKGWSFGRFQNGDKSKPKQCYFYNRIGSTDTDSKGKAQNMVFAPRIAKRQKN